MIVLFKSAAQPIGEDASINWLPALRRPDSLVSYVRTAYLHLLPRPNPRAACQNIMEHPNVDLVHCQNCRRCRIRQAALTTDNNQSICQWEARRGSSVCTASEKGWWRRPLPVKLTRNEKD
ncbi:unnamed protein product [Protopolystoma xenopodis]|uniref:Uncharacterized protein n=1 Tax=Protopolystoma xenopodis TaxID=117903 RepID=A0A3S5CS79_9PLAT|nr:unnamed protein product [Protopolystoma xenopodis]